jgi:hypothetical protein
VAIKQQWELLKISSIHRLQPKLFTRQATVILTVISEYEIRVATHGFQVLPVTAEPSGCPFIRFEADFRDEASFRP